MSNIYFDDLLHLIPEAVAYADDLTIHISYAKEHTQENSERLQWIIDLATKWGKLWKVQFAATKSQSLTISRRSDRRERTSLNEQDSLNILGVKFDYKLTFKQYIETLANKASQKLSGLRRILHLLTEDAAFQLYKSQVRSVMEYACLAWNGAAQTHLGLLDKVEARAKKAYLSTPAHRKPNIR